MGYTHYWRCKNQSVIKNHTNYLLCVEQMNKVIHSDKHQVPLDIQEKSHKYEIFLNGVDEDGHETFVFPPCEDFDFCKTAYKPYDKIVTACLTIANYYLGDVLKVSSDGKSEDWNVGVELARDVCGIDFPNPISCIDLM